MRRLQSGDRALSTAAVATYLSPAGRCRGAGPPWPGPSPELPPLHGVVPWSAIRHSATSPSLGADGSVAALTVSAILQRQGPHASRSRGAGGIGAGAARGGSGEERREAHRSIPIPPRRSTVAPFLQPSLSASSSVRPAASFHQQALLFSLSRNVTRLD